MKKILKYLCYCLPLMAAAVGCSEAEGISEFQPDTNKTGNVTLLASIENADSRASLVATGEARWQANDAIKVVCNDGSTAVFNIDGTGETRRALFTGNLEGKSVGQYALYPSAVEVSGDNISIELPSQISPSPTGTCAFMAGVIDEKNEVVFKQLTAYVTVQINKLAPETASIVFTSDKNLSGLHSVALPEGMESGAAATTGDKSVVMTFAEAAPTMVNAFFALPVGDYAHLTATAYNAAGKKLNEIVLGTLIAASRGLLLDYQIEMPAMQAEKPTPIEGTVNVAGIYWALGNLEYETGNTTEGFAAGWHIAPSQEHHFYIGVSDNKTDITTYDQVAHFNFGGIGANALNVATTSAVHLPGESGFDFSGKMYTDQNCTSETTDFAAAQYGDVAYWASNGMYRMPTKKDMEKLYTEACRTEASYNGVTGVYYFDPAYGESAGVLEGVKELVAADLEVGLFLPNIGRGYDNKDFTLYNINSLGVYRTSTVQVNSKTGVQGYGVIYRTSKLTEGDYYNETLRTDPPTYAYGACARYAIRPIYVSGNVGPVNPTPTPDPTPEPEPTPGPDTDPVPTTGTVTVAGVEWAIGNLYFENGGTTTSGFAAGWSIGAGQHYHLYLGASGDKDDIADLSRMGHFNFGGIENPFINDAAKCISLAGKNDISGKMYTDQTCINATTNFEEAKYGDIAFWASKGAYRMPTADEMEKLYTDACRVKAVYTTADGIEVPGTYYYNPGAGETAGLIEVDSPRVVRNADMTKGLFLPYTGRYQSGNELKLFAITTQGVYRSSTTTSNSTLDNTFAAVYRPHITTEDSSKCDPEFVNSYYQTKNQAAYGCVSRYAIRPVKVK